MLLRCLLVALPVLVFSQRYFLSFVFNNNRNVRNVNGSVTPRGQEQGSPIMEAASDTAVESVEDDQKDDKPSRSVQSVEGSRKIRHRSGERFEHLNQETSQKHGDSLYQKHSDSYEVVQQDELEGRLNKKDSKSPRNHLIEFVSESQENTDEKFFSYEGNKVDADKGKNNKKDANTKGKNERSGNSKNNRKDKDSINTNTVKGDGKDKGSDNNNASSNNTTKDNSNVNSQGRGDKNTKDGSNENTKNNGTAKGNENDNVNGVSDSKDNENTELSRLRLGNIDCIERSGREKIFTLSLPEKTRLNVKFLCNISGYQNPWLLVLHETFPNPKYQADFSGGFKTANYENFAISMDTLSYITSNAIMQVILIGRWDKTKCVYSKYNRLTVGDAFKSYELMRLGSFEGNTSDWLSHFIGESFVDYQMQHLNKFQCEIMQLGGWWALNTTHCVYPEDKKPNTEGYLEMFIQPAPSG